MAGEQSEVARLNSEAVQHEQNAGIIRGSMPPQPSPDDYQMAELAQREQDRAKDKRVLANQIVNERLKKLEDYFGQQTGCSVVSEWKIDLHSYRFYFQRDKERDWRYILDLSQDDFEAKDNDQIINELTVARWLHVLETHSGKRVPIFQDGKFADVSTFQSWPEKARH